jgi:hypothetical protein
MYKVQVVKNRDLGSFPAERKHSIRGNKQIGPDLIQVGRQGFLKKEVIEDRMPCLGKQNHGLNVIGENKLAIEGPVEDEMKLHLGMIQGNTFKGLVSKPANPL